MMHHAEIIIVGGGPVGLVCALTLAKIGKKITIFEEKKQINDKRILALSYLSCLQLEALNLNIHKLSTIIESVHIAFNGFGVNKIFSKDLKLPHLGVTVKYCDLVNELFALASKNPLINFKYTKVDNILPHNVYSKVIYNSNDCMTSDLTIIAQGSQVSLPNVEYSIYDYKQYAIIVKISVQNLQSHVAFEYFDKDGPLVLLPCPSGYVLVWSVSQDAFDNFIDADWLSKKLNSMHFMKRFGSITICDEIIYYPLRRCLINSKVINNNLVIVGNSAQILHPISAQGLNLGFRDIRDLSSILKYNQDITEYVKLRNKDTQFVSNFTHTLAKFSKEDNVFTDILKSLGLFMFSNCKVLHKQLSYSLIYGL